MTNVLRVAIVDPMDSSRESMKSMLLGMDRIWLEAECSRFEFFSDVVLQTQPEIGVIVIDHDVNKGLDLVRKVNESCPDCSLLVVSSSTDGSLILRAMRAGAKEFLTQPVRLQDLFDALDRISERHHNKGETKLRSSNMIAIAGSTGGVGTTSLAVNLGCILAKEEKNSVALVDLDLALGDADVFLDAIPDYTLVDVAKSVSRLDITLLKRSLTKHASGLFLLPRPVQMEDIPLIGKEDFQRVIGLMKATFTNLVVDLSKSFSPLDMLAMEMANHVLLVTQLDLPSLRNVVRLLTSFGQNQDLIDKIKVVVNRVGLENGMITMKKAQETIGREIYFQLPNDYRTMVEVRNNGLPLIDVAPKSAIAQKMIKLAERLSGVEKEPSPEDSGSGTLDRLLSFWPGKSKQGGSSKLANPPK